MNSEPTAHERSMSTFFASVSHIYIFLTKVVSHTIITMDGNENVLQLICFWDDCCDCFWWWWRWRWRRCCFLSVLGFVCHHESHEFSFLIVIFFHMILLLSYGDACVQCSSRFSVENDDEWPKLNFHIRTTRTAIILSAADSNYKYRHINSRWRPRTHTGTHTAINLFKGY